MILSIEISMYPLSKSYGPPILDFIERMKAYDQLQVRSNTMSTQILGDYDLLMDLLKKEIKTSFETDITSVMVMKLVNEDLS